MSLNFGKRRRWPPSRPTQYVLAFIALGLAIAVLIAWLFISYHQNSPKPDTNTPPTNIESETITETSRCLVILNIEGASRFLLVHTDPATPQITVVNVPETLQTNDNTLSDILNKNGSPRVVEAVSDALELSIPHYITLSEDGIEGFVNQFENGIIYSLPENVHFSDENGATVRLNKEEHTLSGGQVVGVLKYNKWANKENRNTVAADLLCAMVNQYLSEGFPLKGYFGLLSNYAITDLRINNFNTYQSALSQIAIGNNGSVCQIKQLEGTIINGAFSPSIETMKKETNLYH